MFLGIRDIVFAKGRFALIASVVGLLTLLLVMLTGLTGGLGKQNTAGIESFGADRVVFGAVGSATPEVSFTSSEITDAAQQQWAHASGVDSATAVGISQTKLETSHSSVSAAVFGVPADSDILHTSVGAATAGNETLSDHSVVLGQSIAEDAGVNPGDRVSIGGQEFTVSGIVKDTFYSHQPVMWMNTASWQELSHVNNSSAKIVGTVLAVSAPSLSNNQFNDIANSSHTQAVSTKESFKGLPAYSSERSSLQSMQGFLYGISALVTISFLTVWTIQRTRDLAVLRDALIQAAIILLAGAVIGAAAGWALGALASGAVPFKLDVLTIAGPAVGIWLIGLAGSLIATARISKIDPMIALGGN
ncbi:MAG: ABC transporter permease [Rothia sp. (in: high G+C Gram-positive bacteria)]|nr:ABC transporter permease [Rothia sp. (in: high G+C Gram-positive bacteria)]